LDKTLEGFRMLDVTWKIAGPFVTMFLSNLDAEGIKVERPDIDDLSRAILPKIDDVSTLKDDTR